MIVICLMAFLFILGIFNRKSKFAEFLLLLFMWCFYALNTYSGDYISYEYVYSLIGSGSKWIYFEPGFSLIMVLCNSIGLSFTGFRIVLATAYIFLLDKTIKKYTDNVAYVLAIFMIFPFMYFASVLRAGVAGLIIVYSMHYLQIDGRRGTIKYIIGVLVATMFHTSSIFFLVFLLSRGEIKRTTILKAVFISTITALLFSNSYLFSFMSLFTSSNKVLQWLNGEGNTASSLNVTGKVIQIVVLVTIVLVTNWACKLGKRKSEDYDQNSMSTIVYNSNVYLLVLIPMMMINDVWIRMIWEVLLINICLYANVIDAIHENVPKGKKTLKVSIFGISVVALTVLLFIYADKPYWGTPNAAINMIYNNLLFKLISF